MLTKDSFHLTHFFLMLPNTKKHRKLYLYKVSFDIELHKCKQVYKISYYNL